MDNLLVQCLVTFQVVAIFQQRLWRGLKRQPCGPRGPRSDLFASRPGACSLPLARSILGISRKGLASPHGPITTQDLHLNGRDRLALVAPNQRLLQAVILTRLRDNIVVDVLFGVSNPAPLSRETGIALHESGRRSYPNTP